MRPIPSAKMTGSHMSVHLEKANEVSTLYRIVYNQRKKLMSDKQHGSTLGIHFFQKVIVLE